MDIALKLNSLIEDYLVVGILDNFRQIGVLDRLAVGATVEEIAREFEFDKDLIRVVLDYLVLHFKAIDCTDSGIFQLKLASSEYLLLLYLLDKYVGAFGPCISRLNISLSSPKEARFLVDQRRHSQAFTGFDDDRLSFICDLLIDLRVDKLIDIGCGSGALLINMATKDPSFQGWGIDANPYICEAALSRVTGAGLSKRVKITNGTIPEVLNSIPQNFVSGVQAIYASSLLNEYFVDRGGDMASSLLKRLRDMFPRRFMLVVDYYGKLGRIPKISQEFKPTALHDLAQAISGQGVPPANLEGWLTVYRNADCDFVHAYEGRSSGIDWFIHLLRLSRV